MFRRYGSGSSGLWLDVRQPFDRSSWLFQDLAAFWIPLTYVANETRVRDFAQSNHAVFSGHSSFQMWSSQTWVSSSEIGSLNCGTSAQVRIATASFTLTEPFTVCAWFRCNVDTGENVIWSMGTDGSNNHRMSAFGAGGGDPILASSRQAGTASAQSTTGYTVGKWHHACGVWSSDSDRIAFIDGGSSGINSATKTPTLTNTLIGDRHGTGAAFSGNVGAVWVYSRALTADEVRRHFLLTRDLERFMVRTSWAVPTRIFVGGLVVSPTPASAVGAVLGPGVVLGGLSLAPTPASAVGAVLGPDVIDSFVFTPTPASAVGAVLGPSVVLGSIAFTPTPASAIGAVLGPSVVLGSIAFTPTPASAVGAVLGPGVVLGSLALTPTPTSAIGAVLGPSVVLGSIAFTPTPASAVGAVLGPSVVLGSIAFTPTPASAIGAVLGPSVVLGAISFTPTPASAIGAVVAPTVIEGAGGITIAPTPASAVGAVLEPSVILGAISFTPTPASAVGAVLGPTVVLSDIVPQILIVLEAYPEIFITMEAYPEIFTTMEAYPEIFLDLEA